MILIIGPGGCGFTFLAWTISFLRGDITYTRLAGDTNTVSNDPITGITAHGFIKDHVEISADLPKLHLANSQSIVYLVPTHQHDLDYALELPSQKIFFRNTPDTAYELFARSCLAVPNAEPVDLINKISQLYDKDSVQQVMLEYNHLFIDYYKMPKDYTEYFEVTYTDIYENLDRQIQNIFDYLGLTIDQDRYSQWHTVYNNYKAINQNFLLQFQPKQIEVDRQTKLNILKEIVHWINGSSQNTN